MQWALPRTISGMVLPGATWYRHPRFDADGAGSTSFGIWRPGVLCVLNWEVPAFLADSGTSTRDEVQHVELACVEAGPAEAPDTQKVLYR